jgi:hypothetical protein
MLIYKVAALVYIPTNRVEGHLFPAFSPQFAAVCCLDDCHLTGVRWNLSVVLIYISFMAREVEHCFIPLLALSISSSENCLCNSFAHLLTGLFVLLLFSFLSSFILDINPLSVD